MAEGAKDQELKPIISNLFPLEGKFVLTAFEELSSISNPSGFQAEADRELAILRQTNLHVLEEIVQILRELPSKEDGDGIFAGILVCHRALRKEAESIGGQLPTFTDEFTKRYYEEEEDNILEQSEDKKVDRMQAAMQVKRQQLVQFENWEPEFSTIAKKLLAERGADWHPEENPMYLGITNFYSLFRAGCSDPKNFQVNHTPKP